MQLGTPADKMKIPPTLMEDMVTGFAILAADGQDSGIAGHLTARVEGSEYLLAHRYGLAFSEVGEDAVCLTDFSLTEAKTGIVSPSLAFHIAMYRARPDIGAIVHSHPEKVISLSATGAKFEPVFQSALMLWNDVHHYDGYDGIVEGVKEGAKFAQKLGNAKILLLKNHGMIAVGKSVQHAVCASVIFHQNCRIQLDSMKTGKVSGFENEEIAADALQSAYEFLNRESVIQMRWRQLARSARH